MRVPAVITGEPVMLNRPVESASPTEVTVPAPEPVAAIVRVLPVGVMLIPVPAARTISPVRVLMLDTPPPLEALLGYLEY